MSAMKNQLLQKLVMVRIFATITLSLLTLVFAGEVGATHIVGGDLSYQCLGDNEYEFTLTFRRDCDNGDPEASFDDPAVLGVFDSNGSLLVSIGDNGGLDMAFSGKDTIHSDLYAQCVVDGPDLCIEESVYKKKVFLPFRPGGYLVAYQRCCRNVTLTNVVDPLNTGSTYFVRIGPKSYEECNSGPAFNAWPDIYMCADEPYLFDHSATDTDGDSLVYRLCTPSAGASNDYPLPQPPFIPEFTDYPFFETITWSTIFEDSNMLGSGTPLSINETTGELTAVPGMLGQYLVGVCVEEYRDGQLLGWLRRDFQVNIRDCGEPSFADFDYSFIDCDDLTVDFSNLSENFDSYSWNFNYPSSDPEFQSDEVNPTFQYSEEGTYEVLLTGIKNNGCSADIIKTVSVFSGNVQLDFDIAISSCEESTVDIIVSDASISIDPTITIDSYEWIVLVDGSPIDVGTQSSFTISEVFFDDIDVTLNAITSTGCPLTLTQSTTLGDLLPTANFETTLLQCYANGYQIQLTDMSTSPSGTPEMWSWSVSSGSSSTLYMGSSIIIDALDGSIIELETTFSNGCVAYGTDTLMVVDEILPTVILTSSADDCEVEDDVFSVSFTSDLVGGSFGGEVTDYVWTVTSGTQTVNYSSETIVIDLIEGQSVDVDLEVTFDNGCSVSASETVTSGDYIPAVTILLDDVECNDADQVIATFSYEITDGAGINNQDWTIETNGDTFNETDSVIVVTVDANSEVNVSVEVTLDNNCVVSASETFEMGGVSLVTPTFDISINDCSNQDAIAITVVNTTDAEDVTTVDWIYTINGIETTATGNTVDILVGASDTLDIQLSLAFENACVATTLEESVILDIPSIVFTGDPILSCEGMEVPVVANPNSEWTYTWAPTDGLNFGSDTDFSNPIVAAMSPTVYTVTVSNGICEVESSIMITTMSNDDLAIAGTSQTCDGAFEIFVQEPLAGITYEWSDTPTFETIIATGPTLSGTLTEGVAFDTYFVQIQGDNPLCLIGSQSFQVNDASVDIELVQPFTICKGDTSQYFVINNNIDDELTFDWGDDPRVIDASNGMTPMIGVSDDEEDFVLYVSVTNQYGCTMADSLEVVLNDQPELVLDYEFEQCGELTVCFTPSGNPANLYIYNFGDPASSQNDAIGVDLCHTFSDFGNYEVALSGVGALCSGNVLTQTIPVFDLTEITVDGFDTNAVSICANDTVSYTINTDVPAEFIFWCLDDNNPIQSGYDLTLVPYVQSGSGVADGFVVLPSQQIIQTDQIIVKVQTSDECIFSDSLNIDVYDFGPNSENPSFEFDYLGFDCATELHCFESNTDAGGFIEWNITGQDYNETILGTSSPCFDFAGTGSGTYTVTVSAPGAPCDIIPVSQEVNIQDMPFVNVVGVSGDTVSYCLGEALTLEAQTNTLESMISWCDADGNQIETGPTYTFTPSSAGVLSVKLAGSTACIDTTLITYVPYDFGPGTEIEQLDFDFAQLDCSSLELCFEANTDAGGALVWDITGNGADETILGTQFPCFDFAGTGSGTYTVTLSAPGAPCDIQPVSQEIFVQSMPTVDVIGAEDGVVNYCLGDELTLTALTDAPDSLISWCNLDGVEIATGSMYTFVPSEEGMLSVKLDVGSECNDTTLISYIPYDFGPGTEIEDLSFTVDQPDCAVDVICFEANTDAGGTIFWTISGNGAQDTILGDQFPCYDFSLTGSGSYTVGLFAFDSPCPVNFDVQDVMFGSQGDISIVGYDDNVVNYCIGDSVTLIGNSTASNPVYSWCENGVEIAQGQEFTFLGSDYSELTLKLGSGGVCGDTLLLDILPYDFGPGTENDSLFFTATQPDCESTEVCFSANTDAGGTIQWLIAADTGFFDTFTGVQDTCYVFDISATNEYTVSISAPNAPCPVQPYNQVLNIYDEIPEVEISGDDIVNACDGDQVTLMATSNLGAGEITWCDGNGVTVGSGEVLEITVSMMSTYIAKVGGVPGCTDADTVSLQGLNVDDAFIDAPDFDCSNEPIQVSVEGLPDGDYIYTWGPDTCFIGDITGQTAMVDGVYSKEIFVTIMESTSGCTATLADTLLLAGFGDLSLEVTPNDTIYLGEEVILTVLDGEDFWDYEWSTGDNGTGVVEVEDESTQSNIYSVTVTDENGCTEVLEMLITVLQPQCNDDDIFIPTAFSPNGDSNNDVLFVRSNSVEDVEFFVYDRWGEEVFRSDNINIGWDGTYNGEQLAPDVYAYCVKITCTNDEKYVKSGNVSLLR